MFDLISATQPAQRKLAASGKWCAVRMCLDLSAQEWLNIGVVLYSNDGEAPTIRLLQNFAGLKCLYDADAADNARFLADQIEFALLEDKRIPAHWNIQLSPAMFIRGTSKLQMVDDLFERIVPLGKHERGADRPDREDHQHATQSLRSNVRKLLSKHLQLANRAPDFWRSAPTNINLESACIQIDLQVVDSDLKLNGAVVSAWYKTKYHRNASLTSGANAMSMAREAYPSHRNILYLLQPPLGTPSLTEEDQQSIQADIDSVQWLVNKHNADLKILRSDRDITRTILEDVAAI